MLTSTKGLPANNDQYTTPLYELDNVTLCNIDLTHLPSLNRSMKKNNISPYSD